MPPPVSQLHGGGGDASAFGGVWAKEETAAIAMATAVSTAGIFSFVMDFSFAIVSEIIALVTVAQRVASTVTDTVTTPSCRLGAVVETQATPSEVRAIVQFSGRAPLARL